MQETTEPQTSYYERIKSNYEEALAIIEQLKAEAVPN